jgi:hypothetical protein
VTTAIGKYNGVELTASRETGMVDLTAMCQAGSKRWADFAKNKDTQEFLSACAEKLNCEDSHLLVSTMGRNGNTWGHRWIAYRLAQWISPEFGVFVSEVLDQFFANQGQVRMPPEHYEARLLKIEQKQDQLYQLVLGFMERIPEQRRNFTDKTKQAYRKYVADLFGGICPCCHVTRVI